jgi:hypothetical protein
MIQWLGISSGHEGSTLNTGALAPVDLAPVDA